MPKASKSILGLSHKFIPVPKTTPHDLSATLERFKKDIHLKAYFAMQPLGNETPKLYVKSTWHPPFRSIPKEIDQRLTTFFKAIRPLFKKTQGQNNLLPFQRKLLNKLRKQQEVIICKTNKGLGPCAIEFSQYAQDVMAHLSNPLHY